MRNKQFIYLGQLSLVEKVRGENLGYIKYYIVTFTIFQQKRKKNHNSNLTTKTRFSVIRKFREGNMQITKSIFKFFLIKPLLFESIILSIIKFPLDH